MATLLNIFPAGGFTRTMLRFTPLILCTTALAAIPPEQAEFFEKRIRPVLAEQCHECHGAQKQKGGLRLDSRPGWQKGGESGAVIAPGKPAESLLLRSIKHEADDLKMPLKRPKLDAAVIADFEKWIALGAPDPRDEPAKETAARPWAEVAAERAKWWSFQPVRAAAPPPVRDAQWPRNDVDRFLLAKLEAAGLAPAADADPRTLIRRMSYILTGLPPTLEEVEAFASECREGSSFVIRHSSLSALADRLLSSPRFGEHWARHWLDLVRYAETHGSEGDPDIPFAWRYRDYVIRAFNADLPLDALIREHIAGDSVPPRPGPDGTNDALLGLAHWRLVEHGFQPVDTRDEQVKTVDSQIDVLTKAFQGLTVSCARCHDHKFDAISQRDYTALAGIAESSRPAMLTLDLPEKINAHREALTAAKAKVKAALAEAWLAEAEKIPAHIASAAALDVEAARAKTQLAEIEAKRAALTAAVRARAMKARGIAGGGAELPEPFARWSFADAGSKAAADSVRGLLAPLEGDARIRDGKLIVSGTGFARSAALGRKFPEKTIEAWVKLATYEQSGGGVISHESADGVVFDAIVFAEHAPRKWTAGSDTFRRGKNFNEPDENAAAAGFVHMAITYAADGTIAMFRNGVPYGQPWKPANPPGELPETSRVLLGLRHWPAVGNRFLRGEIDEARLHARALTPAQVAASFRAGPDAALLTPEQVAPFWSDAEKRDLAALDAQHAAATRTLAAAPGGKSPWGAAFADAEKDTRSPLRGAQAPGNTGHRPVVSGGSPETSNVAPASAVPKGPAFFTGPGVGDVKRGEFTIEPDGARIVAGLLPESVASGVLTRKFGGIAATARFKITTDFISIRAAGANAWCRVIVDGYPLGTNPIFPRAALNNAEPRWLKLDTKYRKGSMAYIEFATAEDLTRREKGDERSWFCVEEIVPHDGEGPTDAAPKNPAPVRDAASVGTAVRDAVIAWRDGKLTAPQHALLDFLIRRDLLPNHHDRVASLLAPVTEFRRIEAAVPAPQRAPGVFDADSYDTAFLTRGDHLKPAAPVPRGYLAALGGDPFVLRHSSFVIPSGRLPLARAITSPANPLTARVMANRIWLHVFGRGIVATPDNFGKMGELPSHPELLDFLATRLAADGWSLKKTLRTLVTSRAFAMASDPSAAARERDPDNILLSHARVRRLGAESIRDTLLLLGSRLDATPFGPGAAPDAPRRSIYLNIRRTALHPFLTTFDSPKPFSTLGRRDATNVPAQSLTLLNDPFVIACADAWAQKLPAAEPDARIRAMYAAAFSRPPSEKELAAAKNYLGTDAWRDLAQSLINLKEFIFVR